MCLEPTTLAALSAGIQGVQAIATYQAQAGAAKAQSLRIQQERDAARMDAERQQQQAYEAGAAEANAHAMQATKDLALFDAISAEGGGGVTARRQQAAIGIGAGQDLATVASNAQKQQMEISLGDQAAGLRASQQLASVRQPSLLEAGLTIAGAGIRYNTTMNKIKGMKGTD